LEYLDLKTVWSELKFGVLRIKNSLEWAKVWST